MMYESAYRSITLYISVCCSVITRDTGELVHGSYSLFPSSIYHVHHCKITQ